MFVILAYDINSKRVSKVMKVCRRYLSCVQESVFEGNLTHSKVEMLKAELQEIIDTEEDAICIYCMDSVNYTVKEEIGITRKTGNII